MAASEAGGSSAFALAVNARTREAEARAAMAVQSAQVLEMQLLEEAPLEYMLSASLSTR